METPTPTLDEFRRLYEAAIALKQEAPWEWMLEDEIWGIRNPETGDIGYVSIMGNLGEHLALALYLGTPGLVGFMRLASGEEDNAELLFEVPHMQASFENREELRDRDREVIKALGLKFRGRQAWPLFLSFVPGYAPWFLTPEEARFLTLALEQALVVTRRLKENRTLLEPPRPGQFLVRTQTDQGWIEAWEEPAPVKVLSPAILTEESVAAGRKQLRIEPVTLQADLFPMGNVREKEDPRPYMGYALILMEAKSELIVGSDILAPKPSLEEMQSEMPLHLIQLASQQGYLPAVIAVRSEQLRRLIEPMATQLGIKVKVSKRLAALDRARRMIAGRMGGF